MLLMKPGCECCDRDLPPTTNDAMICSFECTFCSHCAVNELSFRCPNCGGDLVKRPARPEALLARYPASTERVYKPEGCANAASAADAAG